MAHISAAEIQRRLYARGIPSTVSPNFGLIIAGGYMNESYDAGKEWGEALAGVFVVRADVNPGAITQLSMLFAAHEGFSDMRRGGAFMKGFADGLRAEAAPPQLTDAGGR